MSYVTSVGGDPINPIIFTYSAISMTGNISLVWPLNTQDATYTATDWIDITASGTFTVTMPPANEAGTGNETVFYNYGSNTITVNNSIGGGITTIASGETKRIWITDNSTVAGTWRIANIGSGTTSADASMLAGYGLIADAGKLDQSMVPTSYTMNATLDATSRAGLAVWTGGTGTFTLTSPVTLGSNWFIGVKNAGTGTLTIDGNGATIDGSSTVSVNVNEGFTIVSNGALFYTIGRLTPTTSGYTLLNKSVTGSTDITLNASEAVYNIINYTGTLGASFNVIVPDAVNEWIMSNSSTGSTYTLTIKTALGTGVTLSQSSTRQIYSDGSDTHFSDAALTTTGVVASTYGSSSRVPIYTVNAYGQLTNSTDTPVSVSSVVGTLPVANGGTSSTTLTLNSALLGNGTGAPLKVAPSTLGKILTSDGTTWTSATLTAAQLVTAVAPSTSGKVMTSDGTTWTSAASNSAMVLLSHQTISGSTASVSVTSSIDSTYSHYIWEVSNLCSVSGSGVDAYITIQQGGTFLSTGYYYSGLLSVSSSVSFAGQANSSHFDVTASQGGIGSTTPSTVRFEFWNPSVANYLNCIFETCMSSAGAAEYTRYSGNIDANGTTTGIKLVMSSGNISTCTANLYGVS